MAEADLPQSSTSHPMMLNSTPPEEVLVSNTTTPEEVPTPVKKPRKPRPPKIVAKLATVTETTPTLRPSKEPELPLEFWAGLMQRQKVIMAKRKSDHYNSFRIV